MNKCTDLGILLAGDSPIPVRAAAYAKKSCGMLVIVVTCMATSGTQAQAPIRDRSETATPLEGARRAADVAANALAAAESRASAAAERRKKAEAALAEARLELDAARQESATAAAEVAKTRKADAEARAALAKILETRGK